MALDSTSRIAERYARALFALAGKAGAADVLRQELSTLASWARENQDFRRLVESPVIAAGVKEAALDALLSKAQAHALTRQFLARLARNGRLRLLGPAAEAYASLSRREKGERTARVISAQKLTAEQISSITKSLEKTTGGPVEVTTAVDAGLLGGIKLQIGSVQLDASLSGKLSRLAASLRQAA